MLYGYIRKGSYEKNLDLQLDALQKFGVDNDNIVIETNLKFNSKRDKLLVLLSSLKARDTLVVWRLDCIANSTKNFINLIKKLTERKINFYCITVPLINTSSSNRHSKLLIQLFSYLYELQKSVLNEKIRLGQELAKSEGKIIGAPKGLSKKNKIKAKKCIKHYKKGKRTVLEICKKVGVSKGTYYKYLELGGVRIRKYQKNN